LFERAYAHPRARQGQPPRFRFARGGSVRSARELTARFTNRQNCRLLRTGHCSLLLSAGSSSTGIRQRKLWAQLSLGDGHLRRHRPSVARRSRGSRRVTEGGSVPHGGSVETSTHRRMQTLADSRRPCAFRRGRRSAAMRAAPTHISGHIGGTSPRRRHAGNKTPPTQGISVGREGLEPSTLGLRVPCSAS
jgi:hypothetical protein